MTNEEAHTPRLVLDATSDWRGEGWLAQTEFSAFPLTMGTVARLIGVQEAVVYQQNIC